MVTWSVRNLFLLIELHAVVMCYDSHYMVHRSEFTHYFSVLECLCGLSFSWSGMSLVLVAQHDRGV